MKRYAERDEYEDEMSDRGRDQLDREAERRRADLDAMYLEWCYDSAPGARRVER